MIGTTVGHSADRAPIFNGIGIGRIGNWDLWPDWYIRFPSGSDPTAMTATDLDWSMAVACRFALRSKLGRGTAVTVPPYFFVAVHVPTSPLVQPPLGAE
jgi:hypothetical protein